MDDLFGNADSDIRCAYYGITMTPTAVFDGTITNQPYSAYESIFTQRQAIKSPVKLDLAVTGSGSTFDATVTAYAGNAVPNSGLKLYVAVTESDIAANNTTYHHVLRKMYPDGYGQAITLTQGKETEVKVSGTLESAWNKDHLRYVVWVQNDATKEVLQSKLITADEVGAPYTAGMAAVARGYR
jgi:hypothetical protein